MSKTQQLIQLCGEQRRKNTVGRRLAYSRELLPPAGGLARRRGMRRWNDARMEKGGGGRESRMTNELGGQAGKRGEITGSEVATSDGAQ